MMKPWLELYFVQDKTKVTKIKLSEVYIEMGTNNRYEKVIMKNKNKKCSLNLQFLNI